LTILSNRAYSHLNSARIPHETIFGTYRQSGCDLHRNVSDPLALLAFNVLSISSSKLYHRRTMAMDIDRILATRSNRATREGRPYSVFQESFALCFEAGKSLLESPQQQHIALLERSIFICTVTAIEVYYKDVLDGIFRVCSPSFFEPHLKKIHSNKYDILDLLEMYRNRVHPLELISLNQSFQNVETIDSVFKPFLGEGLWKHLFEYQFRFKENPDSEFNFTPANLEDLKSLFSLRHELVHNPAQGAVFSEEKLSQILSAAYLVLGSDIVLMKMIADNKDPELVAEQ
jgi:hypothetical protein